MKPILILPPKAMSDADMVKLDENGICCVVAENPATIKFVDPLPAISSRTQIEKAAIELSRRLLNHDGGASCYTRDWKEIFLQLLMKGTPLDKNPTQQEIENEAAKMARLDEIRRIAREEAREERAAKKTRDSAKK